MQAKSSNTLKGRRILIIEDEMLVALALEELLISHDAEVLGPLSTVPKAFDFLNSDRPDCVTLDMNLKGEMLPNASASAPFPLSLSVDILSATRAIRGFARPLSFASLLSRMT